MNTKLFTWIWLILTFSSCGGEEETPSLDPANLSVNTSLSESTPGLINVSANADQTIEFTFDPGDGTGLQTNTNGQFTHTYTETNFYSIEVRAYGENGRYLIYKEQVAISLDGGEPSDVGYSTPLSYDGMTLLWQDEFTGNGVDQTKWTFEIGDGCPNCGWGNNELQYYRQENTAVSDGYLTITAKKEPFQNKNYTSSRLITKDKFEFQYGRVDIRAKMPEGQGIWPALWMLGANIDQVSWPACGEVDIMEMVGGGSGRDNVTHGTAHWDNNGSHAEYGDSFQLSSGNLSDEFYVFSIIWTETSIRWFINDTQYHAMNITGSDLSEFQKDFFFIMNIAVGGNWPGAPNSSTLFPQTMTVDYIRVFQPD